MQSSTAMGTWAQKPKGVGASDRIILAAIAEKILGGQESCPYDTCMGIYKGLPSSIQSWKPVSCWGKMLCCSVIKKCANVCERECKWVCVAGWSLSLCVCLCLCECQCEWVWYVHECESDRVGKCVSVSMQTDLY